MESPTDNPGAVSAARYHDAHVAYWDSVANAKWQGLGGAYHRRMTEVYAFLVAPGQRVLEVGCAEGDLLAAVRPSEGVGVDFSPAMIEKGRARHPKLTFVLADAHEMTLDGTFDAVILSDLTHDVWDVQGVLARVAKHVHPKSRIIVNSYSRLWELPLELAKVLGLARPKIAQNWLTVQDLAHLLDLTDFEVIRHWEEVLWPLPLPLLDGFLNRFLVKVWPFHVFAMTNFVVARPRPRPDASAPAPRVSVVVPARNESGNVAAIFARTPELGTGTELIFVEGNSTDDTRATIEAAIKAHPGRDAKLYVQTGKGKGDAVRLGFEKATGDVLMILDADLTVPPEDLPRFYEALRTGKGDMVNGVRLVYPMEKEAMRFFNLLANKGFSLVFWWLLGQPVKDTLCGTKVMSKADYERIAANRAYFGNFDPFGDFDLLFGAARLGMKIMDLPIRYRERTYGTTNIQRWRHGWLLLQMTLVAARRLKFV